ncbi:MAG: hypothetical protein M5R36_27080 [Deltaproteobacteria bacterium]|nr:hypothetical protein [Deltaproteobacteria bacterium]
MENNLVYDTKTGSFHQHYGKENVVRNNILVCSENPQVAATRVEDHLSFTFERNIVYWKTGSLLGAVGSGAGQGGPQLLLQCGGGGDHVCGDGSGQVAGEGYDRNSIIADPLFVDAEKHDYRLKPDSPALKVGFVPFDYSEAGVYGDANWIRKAAGAPMPAVELPPGPPPVTVRDDFEKTPAGSRPKVAQVYTEGKGTRSR